MRIICCRKNVKRDAFHLGAVGGRPWPYFDPVLVFIIFYI